VVSPWADLCLVYFLWHIMFFLHLPLMSPLICMPQWWKWSSNLGPNALLYMPVMHYYWGNMNFGLLLMFFLYISGDDMHKILCRNPTRKWYDIFLCSSHCSSLNSDVSDMMAHWRGFCFCTVIWFWGMICSSTLLLTWVRYHSQWSRPYLVVATPHPYVFLIVWHETRIICLHFLHYVF
jgi:hypothetical protein